MTADIATNSNVGMLDSAVVGDVKNHLERWNVKKLLFMFLYKWMLLALLLPCCKWAGCSPFITCTITLAASASRRKGKVIIARDREWERERKEEK